MKLRASRPEDLRDAVQLALETGRTTRESLYELIHDGYWRGTIIANLEAFVTEVLHNIDENNPELTPHPQPPPESTSRSDNRGVVPGAEREDGACQMTAVKSLIARELGHISAPSEYRGSVDISWSAVDESLAHGCRIEVFPYRHVASP